MSIILDNVGVTAPDSPDVTLLRDISFTLQEGSMTLLIGHAGSGKSTLLQVLSGLLHPHAGTITLDEQPVWLKPTKADAKQLLRFGLTFQFPEQQLFARSIRQEFAYSLRPYKLSAEERERRIHEATDRLDPHGVFAMDRSPFALSGGEQRRLALATTFATAPGWLLMDEPTAGLEAAAVRELLRMLRGHRGGLVVATHDLDTFFPLADRVLVLAHGELVFDGSPQELCRAPEVLARAGVGLPSCAEASQDLARVGIAIAPDLLTPTAAASAILSALRREGGSASAAAAQPAAARAASTAQPQQQPAAQAGWLRRDPRAKWLLYLLLAIGSMGQQGWGSLALAAALVGCAFIGLPHSVVRGIRKIAVSYAIFLLFSVALAGLEVSPWGYSAENAWSTTFILARLFVVLLAGYWLAMSTPYGQLVQGLNWALQYLHRWKVPVASFSLAVSFLFRFIPLILREWQQFSTIVRARGKASVRPGSVRVRDIPALVVPLLLAMFHRAEQMTVALEMKQIDGMTLLLRKCTLQWQRADTILAVCALLAGGILLYT
ncbi:ATP-binding cassette domain-containing protein [Paenibacillus roseipurpureus]|uniref:ATP-binding cassette domain-containing protein n=1 Tax=Paenibacillus roseopurpureus TaxID=2918901 RepID=A0AA96LSV2_9BACL|nr:ATP-binding cassette domain-containing protein [Paenibacillus sp. MBLB1832]WNR44110.1 ATP-binding cassette domain-containing protein [Paenibacillus sp. MBLB1832]